MSLRRKAAAIVFCLAAFWACGMAYAATFERAGEPLFFTGSENTVITTVRGDRGRLAASGGVLYLLDYDTGREIMRFAPQAGVADGAAYQVRAVRMHDPEMLLWEIDAGAGAHGRNVGWWLLGKYGRGWVVFADLDSLAAQGYTADEWHMLTSGMENGSFIVTSSHEYMPPGAQYQYERKHADDFRAEIFWDSAAGWFGVKRLPL